MPINYAWLRPAILLVILCPLGLSFFATQGIGLGFSPDSVNYLSAAKTIHLGLGLVGATGEVFTSWPPLFPGILAFFEWLGVPPVYTARVLNALSWSAATAIACFWVASVTRSLALTVFVGLATGLSPTLFRYAIMLWSESLFVILLIAALLLLTRFLTAPTWKNLFFASVMAGAATQQRYVGGVAVAVGVFCIFLLQRDRSIFTRFSFAFIYGFISSFPTFVWLSRNLYLSGKLAGERFPGAFEFGEILSQTFATVGIMFLPSQLIDYAVVAGVLILLTALSTPVLVYVRYRDNSRLLNSSIVLALFVLAYSVFIVYIATQTNTCCVDRFEGVIFPLLVMQGCFLLHTQFRRNSRFFAKSLLFACFLWLLVPTSQSISIASEYPLATPARHAKNFPILMNFSFPEGALVFSNRPYIVWVLARLPSVKYAPMVGRYSSNVRSDTMPEFLTEVSRFSGKQKYIVWFDKRSPAYLHSLEDIRAETFLEKVKYGDGVTIFRIVGLVNPPVKNSSGS